MKKNEKRQDILNRKICIHILLYLMIFLIPLPVDASTQEKTEKDTIAEENKHYLGSVVNTGKDNGYSGTNIIEDKDPHFGWELGRFYVSGYTRAVQENEKTDPVFLKNAGDTVILWFSLEQDIDCLNGNEALTIYEDENGYDQYFGVDKTNFGRGTLIVRHIDYQNNPGKPTIYTNYLSANVSEGADTRVELFEEGDYEVALNYEIKNDPHKIFGVSIIPTYTNYRIYFRFSVRNGNCMVFPFDIVTGKELTNVSATEHGFYLDLAKSRYLDIDIKKAVLSEGADGLSEDVRFNRPAKDGEQYTDEGIYTITVSNRYTKQETIKKIYVGTDDILKAHVKTGYSIVEIKEQIAKGAVIAEDGTITLEDDSDNEEKKEESGNWQEKFLSIAKKVGILFGIWVIYRIVITQIRRRGLGL